MSHRPPPPAPRVAPATRIDPRGQQFAAALTSVVLAAVLLLAPAALAARAARRPGGRCSRSAAGARRPAHPLRLGVPAPGPAAARAHRPSSRTRRRRGSPRPWASPSRSSAWSASSPAPPLVGLVATGFALVAALLNAVFGFCLGCEIYLLIRRAGVPTLVRSHATRTTRKENHMSRENSLVTAQWVEDHLDDPNVVLIEVDEDTTAYDKGHIKGAIKLDWTTDLQDQVRRDFVNKEQFEALLSEPRRRQRRHRRAVRRQQQLVRRLRLLVLQALRPRRRRSCSTAAARSGSSTPASSPTSCPAATTTSYTAQEQDTTDPRVPRRDRRRHRRARTSSTCAAPTSTPAGCSPRPTSRRSRPSAPGTSRPRPTCRGARRPTTTAPSAPTTSSRRSTPRPASTGSKDTIAYCRIGERSSHTWFVLKELLGQQNVKNYDGSWTEYGSLVGVPVALGDEAGEA